MPKNNEYVQVASSNGFDKSTDGYEYICINISCRAYSASDEDPSRSDPVCAHHCITIPKRKLNEWRI